MDLLPRIEIDGASKTIGNSVVLDQIQLTVKPGEMIGLQGVNGSGKTMLLRLISGLIYPTKGHVLIDGKMLGSDLEFPPSIGFLIENPTFLPQYTGAENLQMLSSLHQMMPTAQIESVLQRVGLHDTKYKKYSLGMKQRLGIAAAVFEQPDIILLDEPTNALDESGITMLENVIQDETSRGATIVMASHDMNFFAPLLQQNLYDAGWHTVTVKRYFAMGKKIRLKRKSTIAVLSILACLVGLASWMAAFYHTNHLPYQIPDKIYQAGDFVPVGNNYFISPDENPDGYSVQVNDAKLLTYQQLFEQYNLDYHEYSRLDEYGNVESNYVYDIELNISNTDNTTGYIFFGRYLLVDKSLTLFYNSTIQALVYPELADVGSLKLKPGANKTLHFFFTPSTGAVQKRVRKVEKMLTEDVFSLCVSEFPARLLIKIK